VVHHPTEIKSLARQHAVRAIQRLAGIMDASPDDAAATRAAITLLDRGYGKPNQPTEAKIEGKVEVVLRDIAAEVLKRSRK
jgi:hypothetical protein